jgi:hypothetical protein
MPRSAASWHAEWHRVSIVISFSRWAATWDNLATERSELVRRHPELAIGGEHEEELRQSKNE